LSIAKLAEIAGEEILEMYILMLCSTEFLNKAVNLILPRILNSQVVQISKNAGTAKELKDRTLITKEIVGLSLSIKYGR